MFYIILFVILLLFFFLSVFVIRFLDYLIKLTVSFFHCFGVDVFVTLIVMIWTLIMFRRVDCIMVVILMLMMATIMMVLMLSLMVIVVWFVFLFFC